MPKTSATSGGLTRRKITTGETRKHLEMHFVECKCGRAVEIDGRMDAVICGLCVQKSLRKAEQKATKKK